MRFDYGINVRSLLALREGEPEYERYEGLDEWAKLRDGLAFLRAQIAKEQQRVKRYDGPTWFPFITARLLTVY